MAAASRDEGRVKNTLPDLIESIKAGFAHKLKPCRDKELKEASAEALFQSASGFLALSTNSSLLLESTEVIKEEEFLRLLLNMIKFYTDKRRQGEQRDSLVLLSIINILGNIIIIFPDFFQICVDTDLTKNDRIKKECVTSLHTLVHGGADDCHFKKGLLNSKVEMVQFSLIALLHIAHRPESIKYFESKETPEFLPLLSHKNKDIQKLSVMLIANLSMDLEHAQCIARTNPFSILNDLLISLMKDEAILVNNKDILSILTISFNVLTSFKDFALLPTEFLAKIAECMELDHSTKGKIREKAKEIIARIAQGVEFYLRTGGGGGGSGEGSERPETRRATVVALERENIDLRDMLTAEASRVDLMCRQIEDMSRVAADSTVRDQERAAALQENIALEARIAELEAKLAQESARHAQFEAEQRSKQLAESSRAEAKIEALQNAVEGKEAEVAQLTAELDQVKGWLTSMRASKDAKIAQLEAALEDSRDYLTETVAAMGESAAATITAVGAELEEAKRVAEDARVAAEARGLQVAEVAHQCDALKAALGKAQVELSREGSKHADSSHAIDSIQAFASRQGVEIERLHREICRLGQELNRMLAENQRLTRELREHQTELAQKKAMRPEITAVPNIPFAHAGNKLLRDFLGLLSQQIRSNFLGCQQFCIALAGSQVTQAMPGKDFDFLVLMEVPSGMKDVFFSKVKALGARLGFHGLSIGIDAHTIVDPIFKTVI